MMALEIMSYGSMSSTCCTDLCCGRRFIQTIFVVHVVLIVSYPSSPCIHQCKDWTLTYSNRILHFKSATLSQGQVSGAGPPSSYAGFHFHSFRTVEKGWFTKHVVGMLLLIQ